MPSASQKVSIFICIVPLPLIFLPRVEDTVFENAVTFFRYMKYKGYTGSVEYSEEAHPDFPVATFSDVKDRLPRRFCWDLFISITLCRCAMI